MNQRRESQRERDKKGRKEDDPGRKRWLKSSGRQGKRARARQGQGQYAAGKLKGSKAESANRKILAERRQGNHVKKPSMKKRKVLKT
jgi:hypothetical protein